MPTNCLSVFDHFVELSLKGLSRILIEISSDNNKNIQKLFQIKILDSLLFYIMANYRSSSINNFSSFNFKQVV